LEFPFSLGVNSPPRTPSPKKKPCLSVTGPRSGKDCRLAEGQGLRGILGYTHFLPNTSPHMAGMVSGWMTTPSSACGILGVYSKLIFLGFLEEGQTYNSCIRAEKPIVGLMLLTAKLWINNVSICCGKHLA